MTGQDQGQAAKSVHRSEITTFLIDPSQQTPQPDTNMAAREIGAPKLKQSPRAQEQGCRMRLQLRPLKAY